MMAFVSTFGFIMVSYLLLIPFIALFKKKIANQDQAIKEA
jgi:DHA2 family multidrug resistance protein